MTSLLSPSLRAFCAAEHVGVSVVSAAGGKLVPFFNDRRPARGLPSRRLAIDLEVAACVTGGVRGVSGRLATGSSNLGRASLVLLALLLHVHKCRGIDAPNTREALARTFERALRLALVSQPLPVAGSVQPRALVTLAVAVSAKLDPESLPTRLAPLRSDPGHAAESVKVLLEVGPEELLGRTLGVATLQDFAKSVDAWACATDHPDDRAAAASLTVALDMKRSEGAVVQAGLPAHDAPQK